MLIETFFDQILVRGGFYIVLNKLKIIFFSPKF